MFLWQRDIKTFHQWNSSWLHKSWRRNSEGAFMLANRAVPKPGEIRFAWFDSLSARQQGTAEDGHPCFTEEMALVWVHANSVHYRPMSIDLAEPPTTTTHTSTGVLMLTFSVTDFTDFIGLCVQVWKSPTLQLKSGDFWHHKKVRVNSTDIIIYGWKVQKSRVSVWTAPIACSILYNRHTC